MSETPAATVVHVADPAGFDVYIGRAAPRARDPHCHHRSIWANPYTGADAVLRYEQWLTQELLASRGPRTYTALVALRGKRLGCWCKDPRGQRDRDRACHGDVLVKLIDEWVPF